MTTAQSYPARSAAAQVLAPLTTLSTALDTLQQTLQSSTTFSAISSVTNTLLTADDNLSDALDLLQRHQNNHARILALRAQVGSLEEQIRDTIRRARTIRKDIIDIHPSIDTDEDDSDAEQPDVDYQQLLNFAARIGKHNAVAKIEAEQQGERLKLDAVRARKKSEQLQAAQAIENGGPSLQQQNPTEIADKIAREAAELSARSDAWHSMSRLPFPAPDMLRMGELGRLQLARESDPGDPEGAVDREAEKLVRETEDIAPDEGMARRAREKEEKEREDERRRAEAAAKKAERAAAPGPSLSSQPQQPPPPPPPTQKGQPPKMNLDFPGDYGDDSDDD